MVLFNGSLKREKGSEQVSQPRSVEDGGRNLEIYTMRELSVLMLSMFQLMKLESKQFGTTLLKLCIGLLTFECHNSFVAIPVSNVRHMVARAMPEQGIWYLVGWLTFYFFIWKGRHVWDIYMYMCDCR